ncbi:MAG: hypothetical protein R2815_06780 [Flavobacteriales bacterium]
MTRLIAFLFTMFPLVCLAQTTTTEVEIPGHFDAFTTDELGNVYALRGDVLELFDTDGRSWLRNSLKTFGRINTIDAFYSLKPMVFSAEQGQLAVLDNTLSVQGGIMNLSRSGFTQVVRACMSVQNHFWFFDERELSLVRVDAQLRPVANTGRLDQLLGHTIAPTAMQEHENWLYVNDPERGILVFDLFGTYARTIPIKGAISFEVRERKILFLNKELGGEVYDMRSFAIEPLPVPVPEGATLRDLRTERGLWYMLLADRIVIRGIPSER